MRELPLERARRSEPGSALRLAVRAMPTPAAFLRNSRLVLWSETPDPLLLSATDVMPFVAVILSEAKNLDLVFFKNPCEILRFAQNDIAVEITLTQPVSF